MSVWRKTISSLSWQIGPILNDKFLLKSDILNLYYFAGHFERIYSRSFLFDVFFFVTLPGIFCRLTLGILYIFFVILYLKCIHLTLEAWIACSILWVSLLNSQVINTFICWDWIFGSFLLGLFESTLWGMENLKFVLNVRLFCWFGLHMSRTSS